MGNNEVCDREGEVERGEPELHQGVFHLCICVIIREGVFLNSLCVLCA